MTWNLPGSSYLIYYTENHGAGTEVHGEKKIEFFFPGDISPSVHLCAPLCTSVKSFASQLLAITLNLGLGTWNLEPGTLNLPGSSYLIYYTENHGAGTEVHGENKMEFIFPGNLATGIYAFGVSVAALRPLRCARVRLYASMRWFSSFTKAV